jgi:hypothetical protein
VTVPFGGWARLRVLVLTGWVACATTTAPPAENPTQAFQSFQAAIRNRDRATLWQALDQPTRGHWQLAWRARRAACELLATFPPDRVQADPDLRALQPTPPPGPADLFAASVTDAELVRLGEDINPTAPMVSLVSEARFPTKLGDSLPFRKTATSGWGYAGFADRAQQGARAELETLERLGRLARQQHLGE